MPKPTQEDLILAIMRCLDKSRVRDITPDRYNTIVNASAMIAAAFAEPTEHVITAEEVS